VTREFGRITCRLRCETMVTDKGSLLVECMDSDKLVFSCMPRFKDIVYMLNCDLPLSLLTNGVIFATSVDELYEQWVDLGVDQWLVDQCRLACTMLELVRGSEQ